MLAVAGFSELVNGAVGGFDICNGVAENAGHSRKSLFRLYQSNMQKRIGGLESGAFFVFEFSKQKISVAGVVRNEQDFGQHVCRRTL
ncbi:hypothetical protein [Ectothiorhodospira shaposhnikovii]|uniref:hypothetical protein n=1 Tax=Ectothiorhodospira shaposhnikovii TaxID=1054 RepID=UPI0019032F00|nr:hypothetical protein [Ectothiorhodospira shaposhnikovii]